MTAESFSKIFFFENERKKSNIFPTILGKRAKKNEFCSSFHQGPKKGFGNVCLNHTNETFFFNIFRTSLCLSWKLSDGMCKTCENFEFCSACHIFALSYIHLSSGAKTCFGYVCLNHTNQIYFQHVSENVFFSLRHVCSRTLLCLSWKLSDGMCKTCKLDFQHFLWKSVYFFCLSRTCMLFCILLCLGGVVRHCVHSQTHIVRCQSHAMKACWGLLLRSDT